jgi:Putative transposase
VRVPANDRARLEHLCRYLLRPPLVQDRLRLHADGRVAIRLKRAWRDGTTHLVLEPLELLARLAALTPRPEVNLLLYHGLLAPHARGHDQVVRYGRPAPDEAAAEPPPPLRNWTWAALMRRAFALDVLACPRCGGRMRVIATIADPAAIRQILAARRPGQPRGPDPPAPAGAPAAIH